MSVTKVQRAVGYAAIAQFMVERYRPDIIPSSVGQHLRYDKQRDALSTLDNPAKWVCGLRQHEMNDIRGNVVVTARDPHLMTGDAVSLA